MTTPYGNAKVKTLTYSLQDLPTSQHRAGLVGLLLAIDQITQNSTKNLTDICSYKSTESGAVITITKEGIALLFDEIYDGYTEIQRTIRSRAGAVPLKTESENYTDPATGKTKSRRVYYYSIVRPRGSFLETQDTGPQKLWINLWRFAIWEVLRGVPITRYPYEFRAAAKAKSLPPPPPDAELKPLIKSYSTETCFDIETMWLQLRYPEGTPIETASTQLLGTQKFNAERVPFKSTATHLLLLHFWPLVAQIYLPIAFNSEHSPEADLFDATGYVFAVPDVRLLETFKSDMAALNAARSHVQVAYAPKAAIVTSAAEAGLDFYHRLDAVASARKQLVQTPTDTVHGVDVFQLERAAKLTQMLYSGRVTADAHQAVVYDKIRSSLQNHWCKRQRVKNLLAGAPWYAGFDVLLQDLSFDKGLLAPTFAEDAKACLAEAAASRLGVQKDLLVELLLLQTISTYIKSQIWSRTTPKIRSHVIVKCFMDIYALGGVDFINYYAREIAPRSTWLTPPQIAALTQALYDDAGAFRVMSLIALSAASPQIISLKMIRFIGRPGAKGKKHGQKYIWHRH